MSDAADAAIVRARGALVAAREALVAADARDEALAVFEPSRRVLGIARKPKMRPIGRVWRLGVLLIGTDGTLHATGEVTRATPPGRATFQANSAEVRRVYRAAAFEGPFARDETVNFHTRELALDASTLAASDGPLLLRDGELLVRWNPSFDDAVIPFDRYLADRLELLLDPPEGA
ncbi:hypothetical protein [Agromyces mangrovi Wang et al. 2018]|uniref:hypothetical protein n=1 Tax=Agromyces mangrovi TaxID=1858653 RepID=UPI0025725477|nr:hypothetical protein [Agromyces mangrovi]BDZ64299.1 hypothetical protein GCM10025877_12370 [Agromyces mangrovi]